MGREVERMILKNDFTLIMSSIFFLILIRALTIWRILGLGATFHLFATAVRKSKLHQVLPPVNIETVETYKHCKYT